MARTASPLSPEKIEARVRAQFGDAVRDVVEQHGHTVVTVAPERYRDLVRFCKEEPDLDCDYCDFTSAVDWGPERGFEVVTHLFSTERAHSVRVKAPLPAKRPTIDSIADLYATANWHERETAEMFGIVFAGHPQPVKLLLSEPFEGHPLRKDFPLVTREAKPWPGAVEGEEEDEE